MDRVRRTPIFPIFLLMATSHFLSAQEDTVADPASLAAETTRFSAATLLPKIAGGETKNTCLSPFSIQSALAMTYAGASGKTKEQMAATLGFPENSSALAESFEALSGAIRSASSQDVAVNVANRLFGARGFEFREAFLKICSSRFGAPLEQMDFRADPAASTKTINAWVEKETSGRIRDLIPQPLDRDTALVLANALYLKMPWAEEFAPAADLPFRISEKSAVPVSAISRTGRFGYEKGARFTMVSVPFRGAAFRFVIFLPEEGAPLFPSREEFARAANLSPSQIDLTLPKFRLEPPTLPLADTLKELGMETAFDVPVGSADFDAMAPRRPDDYLYISQIFHKTFFDLDEKGVEAAAATAVVMMRTTAIMPKDDPEKVIVDRPFAFAVIHAETGACLFVGTVADPRR